MASIDSRLLDAKDHAQIVENFNRVLALIDAITGETGTLAALAARVAALDDEETGAVAALAARVAALEPAADSGT